MHAYDMEFFLKSIGVQQDCNNIIGVKVEKQHQPATRYDLDVINFTTGFDPFAECR
jgi:hypothetical protein